MAQNVGGYKVSDDETNCPIFVTYEKMSTSRIVQNTKINLLILLLSHICQKVTEE